MRKYELMFLCGENHTEPKAKEIAREINQHLTSLGAQIFHDTYWGKKRLAYKIKHNVFGYYFITQFEAEPTVVAELTAAFNVDERVIRYLVTDYVEGSEIPEMYERKDEDAAIEEVSDKKTELKKKIEKGPTKKVKTVEVAAKVEEASDDGEAVTDDVAVAQKELEDKQAKAETERKEAMEKMINEIVS